jgi:Tfp pilus assembly protein PilN
MIKINLLPVKAAKKKERIMNQLIIGILVIGVVVVGLFLWNQSTKDKKQNIETQIQTAKKEIQKLNEAKKKFEELRRKEDLLDKQLDAITKLDKGRDWFIRVLDKITQSVPRDMVWVENIKYGGSSGRRSKKRSKASSSGGGEKITIQGKSYDRDSIAIFMGNLSIIPCDDLLPEEEKEEICIKRNDKCRYWDDEENNWKWDFQECRKFYLGICNIARGCAQDIDVCAGEKREICGYDPSSPDCKKEKERCEALQDECQIKTSECKKLLREEYVSQSSITLDHITLVDDDASTGVQVFDFEIIVQGTEPSVD